MKKIDKIFLFVISLISIAFSVCISSLFYPVPLVTDIIREYCVSYPWINSVFTGYLIFVGICFFAFLLTIVFLPNRSDFLIIEKNKGKLQFSRRTLESTAKYSFSDLQQIRFSDVRIRISKHPEKSKVYVKLSLNDTSELVALTETIQNRIADSLHSSLGITAKSITIRVMDSEQARQNKEAENVIKESRVE